MILLFPSIDVVVLVRKTDSLFLFWILTVSVTNISVQARSDGHSDGYDLLQENKNCIQKNKKIYEINDFTIKILN